MLSDMTMPAAPANMHANAIVFVTTSSATLVIANKPIVSLFQMAIRGVLIYDRRSEGLEYIREDNRTRPARHVEIPAQRLPVSVPCRVEVCFCSCLRVEAFRGDSHGECIEAGERPGDAVQMEQAK